MEIGLLGMTLHLIVVLKLSAAAAPPVTKPNSATNEDYIIDDPHDINNSN
jgi:hypothetical protein